MKSLFIPLLLLALWCDTAMAGGIRPAQGFPRRNQVAKASFSQVVASKSGRKQESSGTMAFSRPGKFRWSYEKPYQQLLVSDGVKLWSYDKDLEQVTVKKLGDALGNTPAAFLAGSGEVEKNFILSEPGKVDGVEIVDAVPKDKDSTFQRVRIGFVDKLPKMMEVRDNFGQVTTLCSLAFERNPSFAAGSVYLHAAQGRGCRW